MWSTLGEVYDAVYRLNEIENILGDEYDLEHLKELVEEDKEGKIMRQTWQCDYCNKTFPTKEEAVEHEKRCGKTQKTKSQTQLYSGYP